MTTSHPNNKRKRVETKRAVSYGILLYKRDSEEEEDGDGKIKYLLGLIPQRNWWTVFKGMPDNEDETPTETASREFQEETGASPEEVSLFLKELTPETKTLHGKTGKKDLVIFLLEGSQVSTECFNLDCVATIDEGYMKGKPEIVKIRWMTLREAFEGVDGAKIYRSQQNVLQDAEAFLTEGGS